MCLHGQCFKHLLIYSGVRGMHQCEQVEIRGQLRGINSLLLTTGGLGLNSGRQALWHVPLRPG